MTLQEKYYALNAAISNFMLSQNIDCPLVKFGVDPATIPRTLSSQKTDRYPYFQSNFVPPKLTQLATSKESGVYMEFEYQISFFTAPESEKDKDDRLWKPWQILEVIFSDVNLDVFRASTPAVNAPMIANLLRHRKEYPSGMVSGAFVPKGVLIAEFGTVCTYPDIGTAGDPTFATNVLDSISITQENP